MLHNQPPGTACYLCSLRPVHIRYDRGAAVGALPADVKSAEHVRLTLLHSWVQRTLMSVICHVQCV